MFDEGTVEEQKSKIARAIDDGKLDINDPRIDEWLRRPAVQAYYSNVFRRIRGEPCHSD